MRKSYRIADLQLDIRTTSEAFGMWMSRSLSAYEVDGTGDSVISVVVGDDGNPRDVHTLYRGISTVIRTTHLSVLRQALLEELEALSLGDRDDAVFLHATLVTLDGASCVIPSYLAPYLARSRRQIERLDVAMSLGPAVSIDPTGRLGPVPRRLALPPDAATSLDEITDPTVAELDARAGRRVDAVCWFGQDVREPIRAVSRARALLVLASESVNLRRVPTRALDALRELVAGAACMELRGDTPRSMLLTLSEALRATRRSGLGARPNSTGPNSTTATRP